MINDRTPIHRDRYEFRTLKPKPKPELLGPPSPEDVKAASEARERTEQAMARLQSEPGWNDPIGRDEGSRSWGWFTATVLIGMAGAVAILPYLWTDSQPAQSPPAVVAAKAPSANGADARFPDPVLFRNDAATPDDTDRPPPEGRFWVELTAPKAPTNREWVISATDWATGENRGDVHMRSGETAKISLATGAYSISATTGRSWMGDSIGFATARQSMRSIGPVTVRGSDITGTAESYTIGAPERLGGLPMGRLAEVADPDTQ